MMMTLMRTTRRIDCSTCRPPLLSYQLQEKTSREEKLQVGLCSFWPPPKKTPVSCGVSRAPASSKDGTRGLSRAAMCFEASVLLQSLYLLCRILCFRFLSLSFSLALFKFEVYFTPQQLLGLLRKLHCTQTSDNNKMLPCLGIRHPLVDSQALG